MYTFTQSFISNCARICAEEEATKELTPLTCRGCRMAPYSCPGCHLNINK